MGTTIAAVSTDVCFSPGALALLAGIFGVIQVLVVYLFRGWMAALRDQLVHERAMCQEAILGARKQRDWAYDGWERMVGLGEEAVSTQQRRERRPR